MAVEQNFTSDGDNEDPVILRTGETQSGETEEDHESSQVMSNSVTDIKLFKRRWLQLSLYLVFSMINNMQCFQYTISSNIMQRYWGVPSLAIEWTSIIIQVVYLLIIFPATYLMERVGLRWTVLIAAGGTCVGAWIKVWSISLELFVVTFIGHTMIAISQTAVMVIPGRLAAEWFGSKEVASATAIGNFGIPVGVSIGSFATVHFIKNHSNIVDIGYDLHNYFIVIAIICTIDLLLLVLLFQGEPSQPPSVAKALQKANHKTENAESIWPSVKRILTNRRFVVLCNACGPILGLLGTMIALLNPLYLAHFENGEVEVGNLGVVSIVSGSVGSLFFAILLDRTKRFRMISTSLCIFTLLSQIMVAISMVMGVKWLVFLSGTIWGFSIVSYGAVAIDLCVESTYPEAEGVALGIYTVANQVYGAVLTLVAGRAIAIYGDKAGHACMIAVLAFATILTIFNKLDLRRSKAAEIAGYKDVKLQVLIPDKHSQSC